MPVNSPWFILLSVFRTNAVVIDIDRMWLEIPEYEALAAKDWTTVGDRTYAELRFIRDELLAEAVARRLDIILEDPGNTDDFKQR